MIQQIIAIAIIIFFVYRLVVQKNKNNLSQTEFLMWVLFWLFSILVILFIKKIDSFVAFLGFSSAGINVILYLAIAFLFYLLFRIRIKMEKIEKEITSLVRKISLENKDK